MGKYSTKNRTSIHIRCFRAESWMKKIERLNEEDLDSRFIFSWIAFNSLYGQPGYLRHKKQIGKEKVRVNEETDIENFLNLLLILDKERKVQLALDDRRIKFNSILGDMYLNDLSWIEWSQKQHKTLSQRNQSGFPDRRPGFPLIKLFRQIYVLRKQIFHGCSSNKGSKNRKALLCSVEILDTLIPIFIELLRNNSDNTHVKQLLDELPYPPTEGGTG